MANLAASAVTLVNSWTEGGVTGKRRKVLVVDLALTGQGDGTDKILASVMPGGMTKIEESTPAVASDDSAVWPTSPSYDGSYLIITDPAESTDADRTDPATLTSVTVRVTVKGY